MTTNTCSKWSGLPLDILELITRRSCFVDRIRIRAVCTAWSAPNRHIPSLILDRLPWLLSSEFCWTHKGDTWIIDPLSERVYVLDKIDEESVHSRDIKPSASVYGWILFIRIRFASIFLYSPFTTEVIKLPDLQEPQRFHAATFSMDATSPKCVIFDLFVGNDRIHVNICSPGDHSWRTFEFNNLHVHFLQPFPVDATYSNGYFYCVFSGGQLGAFNVETKEWTIIVDHPPPPFGEENFMVNHPLPEFCFPCAKLIASETEILLLDRRESEPLKVFKLDFIERRWVYENNLNNRVLFIGCTSFSAPAVGETSQLANTIFYSGRCRRSVQYYGSRPRSRREHLLYRRYAEATSRAILWIQLPFGGVWRANNLVNAV